MDRLGERLQIFGRRFFGARDGSLHFAQRSGQRLEMIAARRDLRSLKDRALAKGFKTLRDAGMELVAQGQTSLEEIFRLTT